LRKQEANFLGENGMRKCLLAGMAAASLAASIAIAQQSIVSKPVPELGYKVSADFFQFPPIWIEGEAAGVAVNSKGHIFLFQRTKPMLSEFDENGRYLRSLGEGLFDHPRYGNSRVGKFDRNGNFLMAWGTYGSSPGEFMLPHSVVIDKNDHVYIGDRENARIQIFDTNGRFLSQWTGIGYPYGLWISPDQHVWMVDGGFDRIIEMDQTGKILGAIGSPGHQPGQFAWGHFLAIASDGKLFVAEC
jgi:hypothetical protein